MARIIAISSGKGGVGKTTTTINLAAALTEFKYAVIIVDANMTTSNISLHLGLHFKPITLNDVFEKNAKLIDAIYQHENGFKVIPADISIRKTPNPDTHEYIDLLYDLSSNADFVLVDTPAGLGKETLSIIEAVDELITVTNPELAAITDAMKLSVHASKLETHNLGVVINRVRNVSHELPASHIERMLDLPILGIIPEDREVGRAIAHKKPVVSFSPNSLAAQHFKAVAARLIGEQYTPKTGLRQKILNWFRS